MRSAIKLFFFLQIAIILFFWWKGSGSLIGISTITTLLAFGRLAGLFAVLFALTQFALNGRITLLERAFGFDTLVRIHRRQGKYAITLMLTHVILIITSYSLAHEQNFFAQLIEFITTEPELLKSFTALVLFCVIVFLSIYIVFKHLKYEFWYFVHLLTYVAILLAFGHQMKLGGDFSERGFTIYWWILYISVLGAFVIFRWVLPIAVSMRHGFFVKKVISETESATSIVISGKDIKNFPRQSGQFMIVRFLDWKRFWQAHPFSLSWSARNKDIRITVKNSGDFTSQIQGIKPGTKVIIDGMHGVFTTEKMSQKKILFIAGGVGITPIRSLIEDTAKSHEIVLVYSSKFLSDIIFKQELDTLSHQYNFPIHYILTEEKGYAGPSGRINEKMLQELVPNVSKYEVYLCGPTPFMNAVKDILQKLGVKKSLIHYEQFTLH